MIKKRDNLQVAKYKDGKLYLIIPIAIYEKIDSLCNGSNYSEIFSSGFRRFYNKEMRKHGFDEYNSEVGLHILECVYQENRKYNSLIKFSKNKNFAKFINNKVITILEPDRSKSSDQWVVAPIPQGIIIPYINSSFFGDKEITITDEKILQGLNNIIENVSLWEEQSIAYEKLIGTKLSRRMTLLRAGTGWGKSMFAFYHLANTKRKTVFAFAKQAHLTQFLLNLCKITGLNKKDFTILGSKYATKEPNGPSGYKDIIFTLKSGFKNKIPRDYEIGMLVVDEIQEFFSHETDILKNVINRPIYSWLGISATPRVRFRGPEREKSQLLFGGEIYGGKSPEKVNVYFKVLSGFGTRDKIDKLLDEKEKGYGFSRMRTEIAQETERLAMVRKITSDAIQDSKHAVVLSDRIVEIRSVMDGTERGGKNLFWLDTRMTKNQTNELLDERGKKGGVLFSIASKIESGFDFPDLDTIVSLHHISMKDEAGGRESIVQIIGRCTRKKSHNRRARFFVIDDEVFGGNTEKQKKELEKLGHNITLEKITKKDILN